MSIGSVSISMAESSDELRDLANWLRTEEDLRGHVKLVTLPIQPGQMGGVVDALSISLSGGGAVVVLVQAFFAWLGKRRNQIPMRLSVRDRVGRDITLDIAGVTDPDELINRIMALIEKDG